MNFQIVLYFVFFRTLGRQESDPLVNVNAGLGGGHDGVVPCYAGLSAIGSKELWSKICDIFHYF